MNSWFGKNRWFFINQAKSESRLDIKYIINYYNISVLFRAVSIQPSLVKSSNRVTSPIHIARVHSAKIDALSHHFPMKNHGGIQ